MVRRNDRLDKLGDSEDFGSNDPEPEVDLEDPLLAEHRLQRRRRLSQLATEVIQVRFPFTGSGRRLIEVDLIIAPVRKWAKLPEATSDRWSECRWGPLMLAVRITH